MTYKAVKYEALGKLCRECINQKYQARLRRQDCQYWIFPAVNAVVSQKTSWWILSCLVAGGFGNLKKQNISSAKRK